MLNNVSLVGRVTKEIEVKKTQSDKSVATFTLALNDIFNKDHTDFIPCVAWNQSAEYLGKYANKGDVVGVTGRISTRNYDGQNGKVYVTEVICDKVTILSSKKGETGTTELEIPTKESKMMGGKNGMEIDSDELPFY